MTIPTEDELWHIIGSYFKRFGIVRHQIESYDNFMTASLPHIVQESSDICLHSQDGKETHTISLCNVSIQRPTQPEADGYERSITPQLARMRSVTYAASILVDIVHDISKNGVHIERRVCREVLLCRLPVMVGSMYCHTHKSERKQECRLDQGGFFIINGIEKALLAQEKLHTNQTYIFNVKQPSKFQLVAEIRSCHELKMRSTSTLYIYITATKQGAIPEMVASLPFIDMHVPVLGIFKLLGVQTRDEALKLIVGNLDAEETRLLCGILDNDSTADMSYDDILEWMGREGTKEPTRERRLRYIEHILTNELLPHMGLTIHPESLRAKACYLGFMVRKLVGTYTGQLQCDDRDHYANKRIDTAGVLMSLLFRQVYRTLLKSFTTQLQRLLEAGKLGYSNLGELINHKKITSQFKYAFSTGNWGVQRSNTTQTGVAQMMSRMTTVAAMSNLRRINTPINREGKAPKPRQLHYTSWGIVCPVETPEGTSCGLIKNLAMMAHVRIGTLSISIKEALKRVKDIELLNLLDCDDETRATGVPVLVNGTLHMYTRTNKDAHKLLETLRCMRRKYMLPFDASISYIDNTICIDTDPGCLLRPILVASQLHNVSKVIAGAPSYEHLWEHLVSSGVIEYVDKQEEMDLRVALWPTDQGNYTHCELHPSLINGMCAALIPFPDHNQSPRNTYQSAMGKQAVGIPGLNFPMRMDAVMHILISPQRPLVTTRMDEIMHTGEAPTGVNAIVCIMCWSGFNQEDSLIVNREALERGLFRSIKYQTYKDEERTNGADAEKFESPITVDHCIGMRVGCYDKLQKDGFPAVGTSLVSGDAVIGKTITTTEIGEGTRRAIKRDRSILIKHSDESIVDAIVKSKNRDGSTLTKVRTRTTRIPIIGDKLCLTANEHEVLCVRGWVAIENVTTDDFALAYDPRTRTMSYERVIETHAYNCQNEQLYEINTSQISLKTTMDHRMFVKVEDSTTHALIRARDIIGKKALYLKKCMHGLNKKQLKKPPLHPHDKLNINDWLFLLGLYTRCGMTVNNGQKETIILSLTNICAVLQRVTTACKNLNLNMTSAKHRVIIQSHQLRKFTHEFEQDSHKKLPNWCLYMSRVQSLSMLQGLMACPNDNLHKHRHSLTSSSSLLCDDIQILALNSGVAANITSSNNQNWCITIVPSKFRQITKNESSVKQSSEQILPYTGSVHCITVNTGIFYVRRHGKGAWTGNSSRHGQKGVIGIILDAVDMPVSEEGIVPDIIVNPHAIPSRMTIGQLMECLMGKLCAIEGKQGDATPFRDVSIEHIGECLEKHGFDKLGRETLHNGMTGEPLPSKIFIGPTYYQRLKHMVLDKQHSRSRGPVQILTRQPVEGRAREGGLRFGEMERDCIIRYYAHAHHVIPHTPITLSTSFGSHGAANVLSERLFEQSDPFVATVCGKCGLLAQPSAEHTLIRQKKPFCRVCNSHADVHDVRMPYAFKLLLQELMAMNIAARLHLKCEHTDEPTETDITSLPQNLVMAAE